MFFLVWTYPSAFPFAFVVGVEFVERILGSILLEMLCEQSRAGFLDDAVHESREKEVRRDIILM